ncbi:MAG: PHP domain-containing protein [Nitrospirales bacterium]|nr:PHP domain-containing protein [Nitrospirales bacterium]
MSRIDLHTHTHFSDGSVSPTALVELALQQNVSILAITDHDTTEGLPEAMEAAQRLPLEIIPGIELSTEFQGRETHMLGYFINHADPRLQARLERLRATRVDRLHHILDRLHSLKMEISLAEVEHVAGGGTIGRPHIAQMLIEKGYVKGIKEAFDRFLGVRGAAYVRRVVPEAAEIMTWITEAGGIPILAHPYWEGLNADKTAASCRTLVDQGLRGLEVFYGAFSARQISLNLNLARKFDLLMTGGSDFHGAFKPEISVGTGRGSLRVPPTLIDHLREATKR